MKKRIKAVLVCNNYVNVIYVIEMRIILKKQVINGWFGHVKLHMPNGVVIELYIYESISGEKSGFQVTVGNHQCRDVFNTIGQDQTIQM